MQFGRHAARRARLLARQTEFTDFNRLGRIAEIIDLGHAADAPARHAGHQKGDAGFALPPALMGVLEAFEADDQFRIGRIGDVPDFVRRAAKGAQQIDRARIALRQILAVADPRHLPAAGFVSALLSGEMAQINRMRRIGDVDDRRAVEFGLSGQRIHRLLDRVGAAMVADIGDPAIALMMNGRLIGRAPLQIVESRPARIFDASGGSPIFGDCAAAGPPTSKATVMAAKLVLRPKFSRAAPKRDFFPSSFL